MDRTFMNGLNHLLKDRIVKYFDVTPGSQITWVTCSGIVNRYAKECGDFKNLLLGNYGKLPVGWPSELVYRSTFREKWEEKIKECKELSPLDALRFQLMSGEKV